MGRLNHTTSVNMCLWMWQETIKLLGSWNLHITVISTVFNKSKLGISLSPRPHTTPDLFLYSEGNTEKLGVAWVQGYFSWLSLQEFQQNVELFRWNGLILNIACNLRKYIAADLNQVVAGILNCPQSVATTPIKQTLVYTWLWIVHHKYPILGKLHVSNKGFAGDENDSQRICLLFHSVLTTNTDIWRMGILCKCWL